jgi:polyisoprenoid-binding protein YceI
LYERGFSGVQVKEDVEDAEEVEGLLNLRWKELPATLQHALARCMSESGGRKERPA